MKEKELEKIFKACANRRRIQILRYLKSEKEAIVGDIAAVIRLSFKATSKHLSILAAADMVEKDQRSLMMFYRISSNTPKAASHLLTIL